MKIEDAIFRRDRIHEIRSFLLNRNCLEVEVPLLGHGVGTDPYLDYFKTEYGLNSPKEVLYFHTSPEFFLKRLLAQGYPDIYFLGPTFRNGELGKRHSPQFTILEWYRIGKRLDQLKNEVLEIITLVAPQLRDQPLVHKSYKSLFAEVGIDLMNDDLAKLKNFIEENSLSLIDFDNRLEALDYLFVELIEPKLKAIPFVIVDGYLPEQAALAKVKKNAEGEWVAERFEIYIGGLEICNAYSELTDYKEQASRFEVDLLKRKSLNKEVPKIDQNFLESLKLGLPECSGVALGIDRLIMIARDLDDIAQIQSFKFDQY